ncbi:MAG TPA: hypothetical protein VMH86_12030 [Rhizomicrobium sp.]|nr:hypothetical protein [Rhizomicrobium sp.]
MGTRETLFQTRFPEFTEAQATKFFEQHGEMVSVNGRPGTPDLFLVALASEKQAYGPLALNPLVARTLCKLLVDAGYGPSLQKRQT